MELQKKNNNNKNVGDNNKSRRQWQRWRRRKTTHDVGIVLSMRKWSSNLQIRWLTNHTQFCSKAWNGMNIITDGYKHATAMSTLYTLYGFATSNTYNSITYLNIVSTQYNTVEIFFVFDCVPPCISCVVCNITSCIIYKNFNAGIFKHCHTQIYEDS